MKLNKSNVVFLLLVIILGGLAAGKRIIIDNLGIYLQKQPIELKNSLDELNIDGKKGYVVRKKRKIENKEIEKELGTTDYIIWEIENTEAPSDSPTKFCSLFITYYTGINDRIPHVPEECYFGAGNVVKGYREGQLNLLSSDQQNTSQSYRMVEFVSKADSIWRGSKPFYVCYLLKVNGEFASNRTEARNIMATNLFGKYSYFAKIEWRFNGKSSHPTKSEIDKASQGLMSFVVEELDKNHWPDLD
ncbi:hypothetical protein [Sedimentisphaera salicampi]|uniref:Methanolan biosynthesis EpsI domain-containing protein n=1 Tax=Sedimentisphaera salicampi TaxID=1941349 RepID=A0A1W6LQD4_9BACT|nr:hypothetical protein [Sedimentisphaera salicampi]ARN57942.1 hypothetical protein STSP1_02368 [Sedimentisphaera salicampi]OXU14110.1 hypothetical protein SMSP1_02272 [Sedimentisphaera salicampi]